ncbi:MAG: A24 family peptidase [Clostridium sp.]|nr:A24 family peptidase [Acetatifactor muris]MCM1527790.1 A24 family peptidase [Bacteroides sp.]MCM1563885.1 A24 family peptidase [Clostridium sp.]
MAVLCASLAVACVCDYKKRKIPNPVVLIIMAAGLWRNAFLGGLEGLGRYLLVTAGVLLLLYPFFRIGGLGAGDVKLMSVCAGYFSPHRICYFLFYSLLISAIISVCKIYRERSARDRVSYFCEYCVAVARSGQWRLYLPEKGDGRLWGICMSGPVWCSVLLGLGGVY